MKFSLRALLIVLLGVTAAITLLGAIGSFCIAFLPENFGEKWAPFIQIKPYFQLLVIASLVAGVLGVWATLRLRRGTPKAYALSLVFLIAGLAPAAIQMYFSATLRDGATAPNNVRVYITAITLLLFLLIRLPGVWEKVGFGGSAGSGGKAGSAAAFILSGLLTLTTPLWVQASHMVEGYNTANELLAPLLAIGACLTVIGAAILLGIPARLLNRRSQPAGETGGAR